jgi:hypothetical protein
MYFGRPQPAAFYAKYGEYEVLISINDFDLYGYFPPELFTPINGHHKKGRIAGRLGISKEL